MLALDPVDPVKYLTIDVKTGKIGEDCRIGTKIGLEGISSGLVEPFHPTQELFKILGRIIRSANGSKKCRHFTQQLIILEVCWDLTTGDRRQIRKIRPLL